MESGLLTDVALPTAVLLGEEYAICACSFVDDEDVPGGVSNSYSASAVLSVRATLLILAERSADCLFARNRSPKSLGRRNDPSEAVM